MQKLPDPSPAAQPAQEAVHDARALVPNGSTANIVLDGQTYTLRITRAGKLILTK
ncbi:hemin uptake protein HemP [Sulfitobacter sp. KE29]|uniref:Hemin uptake protein HemP n=1 Tax=Sulfitobacter faviae TaxID=1775881 RepID=A0AAX3LTA0_9RHOB|nr:MULTISPECIES: hemin uptake protein HemP [Sulfitobacter]MBO9429770.1 hemin uptake protein HemP [Sulfitobacter sp. R18_1]MBO9439576.1 hemin uptake protein HemP [Sulfitobacter sp. R18_2]MDF3351505.1 hemin uptake protein HemP [Sulfitobacter sp. KE12]MDF3355177.1 hemin uptake protein HemP [Sulfitobacter sp. KE27]MDF3358825.1 hemin uptake protein HemP [Sulfitobacter sp. KE33]